MPRLPGFSEVSPMHPRIEARVVALADPRRAAVLEHLDLAVAHLTSVSRFLHVEPLIVRYQAVRAQLARGKVSPQDMDTLVRELASEFVLLHDQVLRPVFDELAEIKHRRLGVTCRSQDVGLREAAAMVYLASRDLPFW
jgi:hypothetical protein